MPDVSTSILIDATPTQVWAVLTDLPGHDLWDPLMRRLVGELRAGAVVRFQIRLGGRWLGVDARVIDATPATELRWAGPRFSLVHPLVRGEHWFRMTPEGEGTRFEHGEHWTGLTPRLGWRWLGPGLHTAYDRFNRALKAQVEGA